MRLLPSSLIFASLFSAAWTRADEPEQPIEQFRTEVIIALIKIDADPKNAAEAEKQVRADLAKIIDKYSAKLRPTEGFKKFVSKDKSLVLVIGANGQDSKGGSAAQVGDTEAKILIVVAGNGSAAKDGKKATGGGAAIAISRSGVAIAVAGNGGDGTAGLGGGGGGGSSGARGEIGAITLGGSGGLGPAGEAGAVGSSKIDKPEAIAKAMKELGKKL